MKNKIVRYVKSIFTQFKDLSIPQIIFFIIGLAFWSYDLYKIEEIWPDFGLLVDSLHVRLCYSYIFVFLIVTVILYFVQIFLKKICNTTIILNLIINIPFIIINGLFFLSFGWGNY